MKLHPIEREIEKVLKHSKLVAKGSYRKSRSLSEMTRPLTKQAARGISSRPI